MKLGAKDIEEEQNDSVANLGDFSGDWGEGKFQGSKRNFKHAKRRMSPQKQSGNIVKWTGSTKKEDRR